MPYYLFKLFLWSGQATPWAGRRPAGSREVALQARQRRGRASL